MQAHAPGCLTASRIAMLPSGAVVEAVIDEAADAFGRFSLDRPFSGSSWTPWRFIGAGVKDISVTAAAEDGQEPVALVSTVSWVPKPMGIMAAIGHVPYKQRYFRLTASGVIPANLQLEHDAATA